MIGITSTIVNDFGKSYIGGADIDVGTINIVVWNRVRLIGCVDGRSIGDNQSIIAVQYLCRNVERRCEAVGECCNLALP